MPFVRQQHTDGRITDYIPQWNHFIDRSWGTHDILRPHDVLPCCTSSRGSPEPQRFTSTGKMLYRCRVHPLLRLKVGNNPKDRLLGNLPDQTLPRT
ncbi:hypothetical protein CGMCC3_g2240 [Colletotrichum fructicola]|nr:uncharacterized protein CGMCC3_g2240 [Colletotrichum fructicola]KAE9581630.1 hypothetical protein CGMCC3_g2240 [Colletotrichum fructicola]